MDSTLHEYASTHLICDGGQPLITNTTFREEAMLYDISLPLRLQIIRTFTSISDKVISNATDVSQLSGGQKVVLMILLALYSKAERILFFNIYKALDKQRSTAIDSLIEGCKASKKEIVVVS